MYIPSIAFKSVWRSFQKVAFRTHNRTSPPQKKETHKKTKTIGKTRGQIKNNGKTKHKTIFRDSSLKHPLSKEFVCFMCFPFFSFFFPNVFCVSSKLTFCFFQCFFCLSKGFLVYLCSCVFLPAAPFGLPDLQGPFFSKQEASPKEKTILHFFKETCIKACPHCPQGIQGSLKEQLLI